MFFPSPSKEGVESVDFLRGPDRSATENRYSGNHKSLMSAPLFRYSIAKEVCNALQHTLFGFFPGTCVTFKQSTICCSFRFDYNLFGCHLSVGSQHCLASFPAIA